MDLRPLLLCLLITGCDESQGGKPTQESAMLGWTVPATRTDGAPLEQWEIESYVLYRGGEPYTETTEQWADVYRQGVYCVIAVDVSGRASQCSNNVNVKRKHMR